MVRAHVRAHVRACVCKGILNHRHDVRACLCRRIVDYARCLCVYVGSMPWTQDRIDIAWILTGLFLAFDRNMPLGFQCFDTPLDMPLCDACLVSNGQHRWIGIAAVVIGIIGETQQDKLCMPFGLTMGSNVGHNGF